MVVVILMVGALFPAVGDSIGKLDLPKGVATLLGGADYGTLTGWMRSEIGAVYGPLVVATSAISVAAGSTAGEEEAGILALTLAHPVERSSLVLAKAAAVAISVALVALGTLRRARRGRRRRRRRHRASGTSLRSRSISPSSAGRPARSRSRVAASTGRRALASGAAAAVRGARLSRQRLRAARRGHRLAEVLVALLLLRGHTTRSRTASTPAHLAVLAAAAVTLTAVAAVGMRGRDLRK